MTNEEKLIAAIANVLQRDVNATSSSLLREDLGLSSLNLVELVVAIHGKFGIDIGRRTVERKANPRTVGDLIALLEPV